MRSIESWCDDLLKLLRDQLSVRWTPAGAERERVLYRPARLARRHRAEQRLAQSALDRTAHRRGQLHHAPNFSKLRLASAERVGDMNLSPNPEWPLFSFFCPNLACSEGERSG